MDNFLGTLFGKIVVAIGVALIVGLLLRYFSVSKTQQAILQATETTANIQSLYHTQNNFTSLTNAVVIDGKLASKDMISGANLVNPWSGEITFAVNASNPAQYTMMQSGVPNDACAKLAMGIAGHVSVKVNNGTEYNSATNPLDAGAATTACNSATDSNTLTFVFGR